MVTRASFMSDGAAVPDFRSYEDGKHRRYELLFAVNGGSFAIAKLLLQCKTAEGNLIVLGNLTLHRLAIGMVFLTVVMVFDIYSFGRKMRLQVARCIRLGREARFAIHRLPSLCRLVPGWLTGL